MNDRGLRPPSDHLGRLGEVTGHRVPATSVNEGRGAQKSTRSSHRPSVSIDWIVRPAPAGRRVLLLAGGKAVTSLLPKLGPNR
jgi:hypothetical protein